MSVTIYENIEQRSIEWNQLRLGKLGGSGINGIIDARTGKLKSLSTVLTHVADVISEIKTGFSNDSDWTNDAMEWGIEEEANVIDEISTTDTFQCGYVTNSDYQYFGISPDLLSSKVGYEIKCPNSKTFVKWVCGGKLPTDHKIQVMDYFIMLPELEEMQLVIYDPRISDDVHRFVIKRRDNLDFLQNMSCAMKEFDKLVNKYLKLF